MRLFHNLVVDLLFLLFAHVIIVRNNVGELVSFLLNIIFILAFRVHFTSLLIDELVNARLDLSCLSRVFFVLEVLGVFAKIKDVLISCLLPPRQVDFSAELQVTLNATHDILPDIIGEVLF